MGNGTFCNRVERFDEAIQIPTPIKRFSTPAIPHQTHTKIPLILPVNKEEEEEERFIVKNSADHYSSIWDYDAKLSSAFNPRLKAEFNKAEHHQKESLNTIWTKKNSVSLDSTQVESTLSTRTHSCINLSSSEKIDELIRNLNTIHTQLDDTIRQRTQQISQETESVLAQIINETQIEQQRLLIYAKEQQTKQDEHYRNLLQKYICQLDQIKAEDLKHLQTELEDCREEIMEISQKKIMTVNEQANIIKSRIVNEEQQQATMKIATVNIQLQNLTNDQTFQYLGTELKTQTNVITNANVGSKLLGQNCTCEFLQDIPSKIESEQKQTKNNYTKTTYAEIKTTFNQK